MPGCRAVSPAYSRAAWRDGDVRRCRVAEGRRAADESQRAGECARVDVRLQLPRMDVEVPDVHD